MNVMLSEEFYDRILNNCRGGYLGLEWCVVDETGTPAPGSPLKPGMFIAAENYYGYMVLYVDDDMSLTECTRAELAGNVIVFK
jgi:hypothetical protein